MFPTHFAGALSRAEDPGQERNRSHLRAIDESESVTNRHLDPAEPNRQPLKVARLAFAGGSTSLSADFGAACCA
ncbi:MAG TPA: hypothetical protein VFC71_07060 [Candidatus Polarisedimenticolia bacterium]|nr:hypothetical protein [Candidatus Polarisedimenticolia bacterium]